MDRNERLLSRIQQERSGHGRLLGVRSEWLLAGSVVLVVAAAAAGFRLITVSGAGGEPLITHSSDEALTSTSPEPTSQTAPTATLPAATPETVLASTRPPRYRVRPGNSLESVAERNGLRAVTLASVNELDDPDLLQPGRELVVPTTDGVVHIVERGETLRRIAERFDVDMATVVSANDLPDPDHSRWGCACSYRAEEPRLMLSVTVAELSPSGCAGQRDATAVDVRLHRSSLLYVFVGYNGGSVLVRVARSPRYKMNTY